MQLSHHCPMKTILAAVAILATACPSFASQDCTGKITRLLEDGDIPTLASLFARANRTTDSQLASLLATAGRLSQLMPTSAAAPPTFKRFSVYAADMPAAYSSSAFRMDGRSTLLGTVQVQVHLVPSSACSVLAIHLDVEPQARVSSAAGPLAEADCQRRTVARLA